MTLLLMLRNLAYRPWRSALLFAGFGVGVGVMVVLLSIGEAMLTQARDEKLVGGGTVTVLPEGLDVEVMKTGGVGGLFFSINNARFVNLQLLSGPRLSDAVRAVAPRIDGKLVYLRTLPRPGQAGREFAVRASGEIPSATRAVGAMPALRAGTWMDDSGDRMWRSPTPAELRHTIDHFHVPPSDKRPMGERESWAEWHYFNVLSADTRRWMFISFIVAGDLPHGRWGGQVLVTVHEEGKQERRFVAYALPAAVHFTIDSANLDIGESSVRVLADGRYHVVAHAVEEGRGTPLDLAFDLAPAAGAYFPAAAISDGSTLSGYTVPALKAQATGRACVAGRCEDLAAVQAYHDHNWGYWHDVDWEWGAARAGDFAVLYGRVQQTDSSAASAPLFLYVVDSLGFRALFRPSRITYEGARTIRVGGALVRVPARAVLADARGNDTLRNELDVDDATGTDTRLGLISRGQDRIAAVKAHPYFIQMKGRMRMSGVLGGERVDARGAGFFETYR